MKLNSSKTKLSYFDKIKRHLYFYWLKNLKILLSKSQSYSEIPIDVLIPVIKKDLSTLPLVIESLKYVSHLIKDIIIVAPDEREIKNLAFEKKCKFVDENTVLTIQKKDINYIVNGRDRSGWIFQQLIKLNGEKLGNCEHYLVVDADTIFLRPQSFIHRDKVVFNCADKYRLEYFKTLQKLLGYKNHDFLPLSFISHHILFEKGKLLDFKNAIELYHKKPWFLAIIDCLDKKEWCSFSEYESYGHFCYINYSNYCDLEYWFNYNSLERNSDSLENLYSKLSPKYKSVSFQHYIVNRAKKAV
ncbi:DUF6492 family protein [Aphanothece sacrum]|nr:DUF6492 family protein [Aphanothece sacrum]GBF83933.1 hypothetical protein AsFPU3_0977 [Aphanothece sacrum FPU3]